MEGRELRTKSASNRLDNNYKYITHTLTPQDTIQGLALKYGTKIADIKRANQIYSESTLFLKKTLLIPIVVDNGGSDEGSSSSFNNQGKNTGNNNEYDGSQLKSSSSCDSIFNQSNITSFTSKRSSTIIKDSNSSNNNNNIFTDFHSNNNTNKVNTAIWKTIPTVGTLRLDEIDKTENQFTLMEDEFNPL